MKNEHLRQFVEKIVDDKNLTVDKEVKDQLVSDMTQKLLDMIDKQVVASMSHGAVEKLNELLDRNATEVEIQQHISLVYLILIRL